MTLVSVELVPRSREALLADVAAARRALPGLKLLNIPDLQRFDLRSTEAAALVRAAGGPEVIPHIRANGVAPGAPLPGADDPGLRAVLVVKGDPPPKESTLPSYPGNSAACVIARYRREAPHLRVYAAFDPYRRAPWEELEEVARKRDAGAQGFFTQPIFDPDMLRLCMDWLGDDTVFWGISPVLGAASRKYWERVNRVVFPRDFNDSLQGNIALARRLLMLINERCGNSYLMPLKVDLEAYLGGLADLITG